MTKYYFYPNSLQVGEEFYLQGGKVAELRQEQKIQLAAKFYFQDTSQKRYLCETLEVKSRFVKLKAISEVPLPPQNPVKIHLYLPLLRKPVIEKTLFQLSEIGVTSLNFFESIFSLKLPQGKKRESKLLLWKEICQKACQNSNNPNFPKIFFCGKLEEVLKNIKTPFYWLPLRKKGNNLWIKQIQENKEFSVLIEPQKGFSDKEQTQMNYPQITLGNYYFSPETAALSFLAVANCLTFTIKNNV